MSTWLHTYFWMHTTNISNKQSLFRTIQTSLSPSGWSRKSSVYLLVSGTRIPKRPVTGGTPHIPGAFQGLLKRATGSGGRQNFRCLFFIGWPGQRRGAMPNFPKNSKMLRAPSGDQRAGRGFSKFSWYNEAAPKEAGVYDGIRTRKGFWAHGGTSSARLTSSATHTKISEWGPIFWVGLHLFFCRQS